jgi:hypothetical protein
MAVVCLSRGLGCPFGVCRAVIYLRPSLGPQFGVYRTLNSRVGISFDCLPRIALILREVGLMVEVGLDVFWPSADPNKAIITVA